jgi:hypothetical protein
MIYLLQNIVEIDKLIEILTGIGFWASIASILGFFISVLVLYKVRNIEKRFLFNVRVPKLLNQIKSHSTNISEYMLVFDSSKDSIITELSKCEVNLNNLIKKVPFNSKKNLKKLVKKMKVLRNNKQDMTEENVNDVYLELNMIILEISNIKEDFKWSN